MTRILLPIILLGASLALFITYTNPVYQNTKQLSAQAASYDDALNKAQQLRALRDQLLSTRASFAETDITKLTKVLPDSVDNIRLIIDINNIASRHHLALSQVDLGDTGTNGSSGSALAAGPSGSPLGSVEIGFALTATYDDLLAFEQDLEHSLRLVDVDKITFSVGQASLNTYVFGIKTYWLH